MQGEAADTAQRRALPTISPYAHTDFDSAGGFCKASCNRCPGQPPAAPPACSDLSPDGLTPCQEEASHGRRPQQAVFRLCAAHTTCLAEPVHEVMGRGWALAWAAAAACCILHLFCLPVG